MFATNGEATIITSSTQDVGFVQVRLTVPLNPLARAVTAVALVIVPIVSDVEAEALHPFASVPVTK